MYKYFKSLFKINMIKCLLPNLSHILSVFDGIFSTADKLSLILILV